MTRRIVTGGVVALSAVLVLGAPSAAHVTVRPDEVAKGDTAVLTFRVPNERDDAGTTQVVVQLPPGRTFAVVEPQPVPGWTATVGRGADATTVTWNGGPLTGDDRQDLPVRLGPLPRDADVLVFKALQTYDDGEVVRWIEERAPGGPEPEHPAPTLRLAGPIVATTVPAATAVPGASDDVTVTTADDPVIGGSGGDDAAGGDDEGGASGVAIAGAVVVALAIAGGGAAMAGRRRA